jgi:uncharacterized membrane protein YebE (DUF533 family)
VISTSLAAPSGGGAALGTSSATRTPFAAGALAAFLLQPKPKDREEVKRGVFTSSSAASAGAWAAFLMLQPKEEARLFNIALSPCGWQQMAECPPFRWCERPTSQCSRNELARIGIHSKQLLK